MKYFEKIKKYGVISSIVIVLKMILRINIMKFHYMKLTIDYEKAKKESECIESKVKELTYDDFLLGDKMIFNKKKLEIIKYRCSDTDYKAYGIVENNILIYSTWISLKQLGLPIKSNIELLENEGLLEDSYCHPSARGKGLHSIMNHYRLRKLYEFGKTECIVIVLDGNIPAYKVQMKSGFEDLGVFYIGKILGIRFSTLNKSKYDN